MPPLSPPPLTLALAGLTPIGPAPADHFRAALALAAQAGCAAVHLDGTLPGMRARELDRSARNEIGAAIRRAGLVCSGLDLWIPPEHLAQPSTVDRAATAAIQAIELAADVARASAAAAPAVSLLLPHNADPQAVAALASAAERFGVALADHAMRDDPAVPPGAAVGAGVDPAAALAAGRDPAALATAAGPTLVSPRLSDINSTAQRCAAGTGRLDVLAYAVAIITAGCPRPVVLDVRSVADTRSSVLSGAAAWRSALTG